MKATLTRILRIAIAILWLMGFLIPIAFAQRAESVPCTYMVRFQDPASLSRARAALARDLKEGEGLKYPFILEPAAMKHAVGLWLRLQTCRAEIISKVKKQPGFALLEEKLEATPLYMPSDPAAATTGGQYPVLSKIKAYQAWDTVQGDTSVFIGILDTGSDYLHPDLGRVARNFNDPVDGLDNDHNGLIDDYWGYDLGDRDNDPAPLSTNAHGTNVASISSATTDNALGVAGIGFKCFYRPYKIYGSQFSGYEAIYQAAVDGCKVINCSWGRNGYPTQWEQDVINYVVNVKRAAVVAAAGNTAGQYNFFPASYDGVISVGFTNPDDLKNPNSTVSPKVDIVAPGGSVFGIQVNGMYGDMGGGSSFASPMVAAGVALVRSRWPGLSPAQVEALLKAYSDPVDTLTANRPYRGLMGAGRLDLARAVSGPAKYAGVLSLPIYKTPRQAMLLGGDTVSFNLCFTNLINKLPGLNLHIRSLDTNLVFLNYQFSKSDSLENTTACTESFPFRARVKPKVVNNRQIVLEVMATSPSVGYSQKFYHVIRLQRAYFTVGTFNRPEVPEGVAFTVAANGRLGFIDDQYVIGDGFRVSGKSYLGEAGLVMAKDSIRVVSNVLGQSGRDRDLLQRGLGATGIDTARNMHWVQYTYSDSTAPAATRIGLRVKQLAYVIGSDSLRRCGFNEYTIQNVSAARLDSLHTGLVVDWDVDQYMRNASRYNGQRRLGVTVSRQTGAACATLLLAPSGRYGFTGVDLATGIPRNINVFDGLSRAEKFKMISGYAGKPYAGFDASIGENTITAHGTRLDSISRNGFGRFAAILIYGDDSLALQRHAFSAETWFRTTHSGPAWNAARQFTLCKGDSAVVASSATGRWNFYSATRQRIGQGSSLTVPYSPGIDSLDVFAANADSVFEGMPVSIRLRWVRPEAIFTLADTIDLHNLPWPVIGNATGAASVHYTVYKNGQAIYETSRPSFNLTDTILVNAGRYTLCQVAVYSPICTDTSCRDFVAIEPVNTKNIITNNILVLPNPAKNYILVKRLPTAPLYTPCISDAMGRCFLAQILERSAGQMLLSVADLPAGFYMLTYGPAKVAFVKAGN